MASFRTLLCFVFLNIWVIVAANEIIIVFNITEEVETSKAFGNIAEMTAPFLNTNETDLRYYFSPNEPSDYQSLFSINDITGDIFTAVVLDREDVCKFDSSCVLEFSVLISSLDLTYYKIVTVRIFVEDKNDNKPMFPTDRIMLNISEGSHIGSMFRISPAQDLDTGNNNSVQSYEIIQNPETSGTFSLSVSKSELGTFRVSLVVNKILDREVKDSYSVKVIAKDGGEPALSGTLTVNIQVQDTNDNPPVFSKNFYNITVEETVTIDETILFLNATDKDIGENGRITYRIKEFQKGKDILDQVFRLNELTGELKVRTELTSYSGESYQFIIEALDHGDESFVTEVEVLVHIEDSGNNSPVVSVGFLAPGNKRFVNISENSSLGAFVAHVNVDDTDRGDNGNVSCEISDNHFGINDLESKGFIVVVKSLLDREVKNTYNLTVTCSDRGTPVMSGQASFLVHVTDKNDNKPVFDNDVYSAKIAENNVGNEIILRVSASDEDLDKNAQVMYAIHDDGQGKFIIDRMTGVVSVNAVFDRENASVVTFHVLAIDHGETPLTGTATVSLTIEDKNDNAPEFTNAVHGFSILENQPTGTNVAKLFANDKDIGLNAAVSYEIAAEYVDRVPFILFANGELQANKQLDREERSRYDFVAIVKDQGEVSLSSSTHVTVVVLDDNDNAPIFTFPDPSNNSISVLYPDYEFEYVATVEAYDLDEGNNKNIQYSIKSGDIMDIFEINQETGMIIFKNKVDIGADKIIELEIAATDKGNPPKETVKKLFVELKYTNATFLKSSDEDGNSLHIIISVVVVLITVVISGIILGVIFLLRRKDRKKKMNKVDYPQTRDNTDFGFNGLTQSHTIISPDTLSSGSVEGRDPIKKKEVSFILDTSDSTDCPHEMQNISHRSSFSRNHQYKPAIQYSPHNDSGLDVHDLQKEANVQLQSIKLQQMIMQSRAKQWVQNQHQQYGLPPHDDHHSEGSSETIGSDSGRGCSEEDDMFSSPSADDPKLFDVLSPESQRCFVPPQRPSYPNREVHRTSSYVKKPWTRKPHLATKEPSQTSLGFNKNLYRNANIVHSDELRSELSSVGHNRMSWGSAYHGMLTPMDYTGDSALHSFFNKTPMCVLRDEDDNCSTTTSGSYTIQSEEIL